MTESIFPCKSPGSEKEMRKERLTIVQLIGANAVLGVLQKEVTDP
jgi:hypothetical protein